MPWRYFEAAIYILLWALYLLQGIVIITTRPKNVVDYDIIELIEIAENRVPSETQIATKIVFEAKITKNYQVYQIICNSKGEIGSLPKFDGN